MHCTEFFYSNTNECHLYKPGCTFSANNNWNWYKLTNVDIGNQYDTWFNIAVTNPACGIKKFYLGGCDAGGYANTKYTDLNSQVYMKE